MQKRIIELIGLFVLWSSIAEASIAFLPRYTGDISGRYNSGGRDKTSLTCAQKGMYDKPTDSCKVCQGAVGDCCASISCSTSSECYQYSAADANKYICSESCTDGNGVHYKDCKFNLTCADVYGLTSIEANPYISAGFSCSQTRTTCTIMGTSLGPCTQYSVVNGGSSSGGLVSGGSVGGFVPSIGGSLGGSLGGIGSSDRQSITCYTCLCPAGTTSEPEEGKECTVSHQVGNSKCYTCEENICPLGTYGEDCTPCPVGSYSDTVGASSCKDCPAGYKSKSGVTGATSMEAACEPCPEGTYKTTVGSGSCTPCPTGYVAISGVTGATSMAQACTKACIKCSTAMYPLLTCPSHAVCEECTPKNCEDNTTRYKISYCEDGYKQSGTSCVAKTCEELGYLSSIPSGQNCTPISTTAGTCYTNCSSKPCEELLLIDGYTVIHNLTEFNSAITNQTETFVLLNDINIDGDLYVYSNILTPENFKNQYSQCSGVPTISVKSMEVTPPNRDLKIYPNINFEENLNIYIKDNYRSGTAIFYGSINGSNNSTITLDSEFNLELRGTETNVGYIYGEDILVGSKSKVNQSEYDSYDVRSLTLEDKASWSNKIQNGSYYWYTITSSGTTTYTGRTNFLPNSCSSSGSVNSQNGQSGICTGNLSYLCETASDGNSGRTGTEKETQLSSCLTCGTESCSTVVSKKGILVTDGSQISGNVTQNLYLAKSVTVNDIRLDNAGIYSAASSFVECSCDSSIEKDPVLTVTGTFQSIQGSRTIQLDVKSNIATMKPASVAVTKDITIKKLYSSIGSSTQQKVTFGIYKPVNIDIEEAQMYSTQTDSNGIIFDYNANNVHVNIGKVYCYFGSSASSTDKCYITAENSIDDSSIYNGGTFKYCPIAYSDTQPADYIWVNEYSPDEIKKGAHKNDIQNYEDYYPEISLTCN